MQKITYHLNLIGNHRIFTQNICLEIFIVQWKYNKKENCYIPNSLFYYIGSKIFKILNMSVRYNLQNINLEFGERHYGKFYCIN